MKKICGVIGHPIKHSLSPAMHNAVFRELDMNHDCTYNAFDVTEDNLENFIRESRGDGDNKEEILGLNVTIPHKIKVIGHINELSREAELIGAVNTIKFNIINNKFNKNNNSNNNNNNINNKTKNLKGYNTDGLGCIKALEEAGIIIGGKNILILGAGGAGRAIAFQLVLEGANITISNRTNERAVDLVREIEHKMEKNGIKTGGIDAINFSSDEIKNQLTESDILINTTPIGMFPNTIESPLPKEVLNSGLSVMDIVYNPLETKLLREAKKKGCTTVDGIGMLVHQGAESLKIWFDIDPPIDIMRKAALEELHVRARKPRGV